MSGRHTRTYICDTRGEALQEAGTRMVWILWKWYLGMVMICDACRYV